MAKLRQLIPIPCANGTDGNGKGKVSVYFSPRILAIAGGGGFGSLPDWSDWPAALAQMTVSFTTNNGTVPQAQVTQVSTPSSAIWSAVFAADTPVTLYQPNPNRTPTPFVTFPEGAVAGDILSLYTDLAIDRPVNPPTAAELLARPATSSVLSGDGQLAADLALAKAYQQRLGDLPPSTPPPPTWDFHQAISLLGRHPQLMRLLGIVVDYTIPLGLAPTSMVAVSTDWDGLFAPDPPHTIQEVSPRVRVDSDFRIAPLRGELQDGFLTLGGGAWELVSLDVTDAIKKLGSLAREVVGPKATGNLPTLGNAGLALLRSDRETALQQQFSDDFAVEQQFQLAATINDEFVDLYAEHLRVGYRVDVRRNGNAPLTLFGRQGTTYHFPADDTLDLVPDPDEGWVGTSYATDRSTGSVNSFRLPDTLARWRGWSLAVPPAGQVADAANGGATTPRNETRVGDTVQFAVDYHVLPGSLPRLRYGAEYQMRARAVDITGNSVPLSKVAPGVTLSPLKVYGRLEPLPAPVVMRRSVRPTPGIGDTVDRLVIKSNYDTLDSAIPTNDRIVFPPAASQVTCERHGMPNGGLSGSTADYALLAARDGLDPSDQCLPDPATGEPVAGSSDGSGGVDPGPTDQIATYLPDPAGPSLSLADAPGATGVVLAPFAGTWPAWTSRRIILKAALGPTSAVPVVDTASGDITITLPKAGQQVIDLSVAPGAAYAEHFGLFQEMLDTNPGNLNNLRTHVEGGRHWMVSGRRQVKLVHAVRQPLVIPGLSSMTADRPGLGTHNFSLAGVASLNRPSTGRTILTGTWTDPVDDLSAADPGERSGRMLIGTQKIPVEGDAGTAEVNLANRFADAKRHQLFVEQEAFTRFARDFSEQHDVTFGVTEPSWTQTLNVLGVLAASVKLRSTDGVTTYVEGADYALDAAAGQVTRLDTGGLGPNTTVTATFVALPLSRFSDEAGAAAFEVTIPNAKVPAPLQVHSVIPSFKRTQTETRTKILVRTDPHVVRVYLERPWYDTGIGEQLGVVLDTAIGGVPTVPPYTRFARDAILKVGDLPRPQLRHFPASSPGVGNGYTVAGHDVAYDAARRQWYADIELDGTFGYRMFVQLGLARFQPEAINDAGLSRVAVQDPVLLGATRTVTVTRTNSEITVSVVGPEHEGRKVDGRKTLFNKVTLSVQAVDSAVEDAELRWSERPLGSEEITLKRKGRSASTTWTTSLKRSAVAVRKEIRLVVTEWEPMAGAKGRTNGEQLEYRPVFTEVVVLPESWT